MTEQGNGSVELENETEALDACEGKAEADTVISTEPTEEAVSEGADGADAVAVSDEPGADTAQESSDPVYLSGLSAQGIRNLLIDINYSNRGRVGYEADDQKFIERFAGDEDVISAKSRPAIRRVVLDKVAAGRKSGHPRGR
jgi:uracil-DNA glycosylase